MKLRQSVFNLLIVLLTVSTVAARVLIPMDTDAQKDHLKAYGIAYWVLARKQKVKWLLNYRGGSFLIPDNDALEEECKIRGVSYEVISEAKAKSILEEISSPSKNEAAVILEKAPKIAVYTPKDKRP